MQVPAAFELSRAPGFRLWRRRGLAGVDADRWRLEGETLLAEAAGEAFDAGRGFVRRVDLLGRPAVWRVNAHGGLFGRILGRRFLSPDRLEEELTLSETLRGHGVQTPEVLVALARRSGACWRQHLVTAEVPGARTVFEAREQPLALEAADALLEELFRIGLWAPDLHPANMLWQEEEERCWVIDLADCRLLGRPLTAGEQRVRRWRFVRYFRNHDAHMESGPFRWP
ncbi:MAG: hypothetical protein H8E31_01520 [Planctomycetes bacterium]|nr:hypothetical protein [Planctomycetota bacterium]